mmetsp:Transcript_26343/g.42229  ORF Transcript_26343/g.42229 Transcript_26343/m.42229 type:complete len:427 (+) Transcript_26343:147-1427(+)
MVQTLFYNGRIKVTPRKFKRVVERRRQVLSQKDDGMVKEGNVKKKKDPVEKQESPPRLPIDIWESIVGYAAMSPRALKQLYATCTMLHNAVVDNQHLLPPIDDETRNLVEYVTRDRPSGAQGFEDPNDEFCDITKVVSELQHHFRGKDNERGVYTGYVCDYAAAQKLAKEALPKHAAVVPEWAAEWARERNEVYSPRPYAMFTYPAIRMHIDKELGCPCLMARYNDEAPEDTEDGASKLLLPEAWLHYVCLRVLEPLGYEANGSIVWVGEYCNAGLVDVVANRVSVYPIGSPYCASSDFPHSIVTIAAERRSLLLYRRSDVSRARDYIHAMSGYGNRLSTILPGVSKEEHDLILESLARKNHELAADYGPFLAETRPDFFRINEEDKTLEVHSDILGVLRFSMVPKNGADPEDQDEDYYSAGDIIY